MVSSLETTIDETEKKYEEANKLSEERLKQALEAESKLIQLKTDNQRLFQRQTYPSSLVFMDSNLLTCDFDGKS